MNEKLDLTALRNAVSSLEDSLGVVSDSAWFDQQSKQVKNTLVAGVIQNFEFVYEIGIKMLKRQIEAESASPEEVDETNFREVLRVAAEKGLIADVEAWFKYRQMRNITAHTYDHEKAKKVYQGTLDFIVDARDLLQKLEARDV
ncbi:nucleotidyltransferase substrate binding protein [Xanthomonas nasturtii]|uniref:nucleotidyltransferase substrate binding protein n=1 Tax=Xanthomonas nasturtii TaxID=1843581 RepID=UPI000AD891E2|nr:nucleotidyltransferase substrate binding protein [Xanthomonas nasturtii]MCL1571175.1 nucleotidyltransferase substrate binding protein [Xanthomonas nasturtii]MCL1574988.1 nucleotidyltransferase substrate binding protein [Xanthomonas nasturtii]MCL1582719.1 nucleotidyltransferase substrate binding protein [Xanthomonas nasturtii]MCL1586611.1 nucleotidyltransferase substrate binding protein [Xanthomonas nasturtii]MCL1592519.1 nucleotidyltransferase substrate binding protein [Xanthomonas nasturti